MPTGYNEAKVGRTADDRRVNLMHEQGPEPGLNHWHDATPHANIWPSSWDTFGFSDNYTPCLNTTENPITTPSPYLIDGTGHIG